MVNTRNEAAEVGWFKDPCQIHDERWISEGVPTELVRDGAVESLDPPPSNFTMPPHLIRFESHQRQSGSDDLRRADDAQRNQRASKSDTAAALDAIVWHPFL